ncbi:MAG: alpha/beta fold hydrolase [Sandaracinaceae bacterium]
MPNLQSQRRWRVRVVLSLGLAAVLALALGPVARHLAAARMLTRFAADEDLGTPGMPLTVAGMDARAYGSGPPLLLVHGVHPGGMHEPRLIRFARILAAEGYRVVTPQLSALAEFRLDPETATRIAQAARELAEHSPDGRIGVVGISIGGGMALMAADGEPAIRAVLAIGAHHDARRLTAWWLGEGISGPDGVALESAPPETYGLQVLAHAYAEEVFGPDEAPAARRAIAAQFDDSHPPETLAPRTQARLQALRTSPAPPWLAPVVDAHRDALRDASPVGHLGALDADVFLLHGLSDPVVPPVESGWIASELPAARVGGVLQTPLIGHAERHDVGLAEQLRVVHLVAGALGAL